MPKHHDTPGRKPEGSGWTSILITMVAAIQLHAADYHVDPGSGDDTAAGTTPAAAWQSLAKVCATEFRPGDRILLRAGRTHAGQLAPRGSGREGQPIRIDRYGDGAKPIVDGGGSADDGGFYGGQGKTGSAVYLLNQEYWEIANLDIINRGKDADYRRGVRVEIANMGVCHHIHLRNLDVHDINGLNKSKGNAHHELSKQTGGIFLCVTGEDQQTRFSGVLIEGCSVRACDRSGISVGARKHWYPEWNKLLEPALVDKVLHRDVVIRNNVIDDMGGDGIVIQYALAPLVEYNVCRDAAKRSFKLGQYSAGIWPWMCENAVFQFNEVSFTRSTLDGQGFDCDSGRGTIYQYNYSHDNEGGFMLFCQGSSVDSIVRYNVSRNDRFALFTNSGGTAKVCHNVFHIGKGLDTDVNFSGATGKMEIRNNVFFNEGTRRSPRWGPYTYAGNLYEGYDSLPGDPDKITGNPGFVDAAAATARVLAPLGELASWHQPLAGYRLRADSPCLNRGVDFAGGEDSGRRDLWGNRLFTGRPDIGAWEMP